MGVVGSFTLSLTVLSIWMTFSDVITPFYANAAESYYPRNYSTFDYLINHPKLCLRREEGNESALTLLLMVFSKPSHFEAREAIRQTWGSVIQRTDVSLAFLMGAVPEGNVTKQINMEDSVHGDILQEDFLDTYRNLTLKSVMMLRWVHENCENLPLFVLKIDDDCFLNTKNAFEFLKSKTDAGDAIYGRVYGNHAKPHRNKKSKWFLSKEEYPPKEFPDFTSGPSYFLTGSAVPRLYEAVFHNTMISLEDVFVNGICAKHAGIPNKKVIAITAPFEPKACKVGNSITFHDLPPQKLAILWWIIHDSRFEEHCKNGKLPDRGANLLINSFIKKKDI